MQVSRTRLRPLPRRTLPNVSRQDQLGADSRGEGPCVGRDSGDAITDDYPSPSAFAGGTIDRVAVDVSGEPYLEREAQAMLARE
jgi:hypothetical protein